MQQSRRVRAVWNWLPAFRAVAETQHITRAAELLHVSPSAVSRMIKLLEAEVGQPLFHRSGGALTLSSAGEELLLAVRDSIRRVDDGLDRATSPEPFGPLFVMSADLLTDSVTLPALVAVRTRHPGFTPHIQRFSLDDSIARLLRGHLDVAVVHTPVADRRLAIQRLGAVSNSIYCGNGHPLFGQAQVTTQQVLAHRFIAVTTTDGETPADGWRVEMRRDVDIFTSDMCIALAACRSGQLLAALPDVVARRLDPRLPLFRVPVDMLDDIVMYGLARPELAGVSRAEILLTELGAQVAASQRPSS